MSTFRRHIGNMRSKWVSHGYRSPVIMLVICATVIYIALTGYPIYLTTDSGSLDEDLPALLNLNTNEVNPLALHSNDSRLEPSRLGFMFGSQTSHNSRTTWDQRPPCPLYPRTLRGAYGVDENARPDGFLDALSRVVRAGGRWMPSTCHARQHLAVIIPYRDRATQLRLLLFHLHPFLQRQKRHYQIFVVEQAYSETFNKGMLMNVAFTEVMRRGRWDCIVFHDVDMIPENDRNIYECTRQPRHLSSSVNEMRYLLMYWELVGGALALTPEQVVRTNGYSNLYWGWGGEDDDMFRRIVSAGYEVTRPASNIGRYKMVRHKKRKRAASSRGLIRQWRRWRSDGVNSLGIWNVTVLSVSPHALYTNITVDVGTPPLVLRQAALALTRTMHNTPPPL